MTAKKKATKRKRSKKLGRYEFRCEKCKTVHTRGAWAIAHFSEDIFFTCDCGEKILLRAYSI